MKKMQKNGKLNSFLRIGSAAVVLFACLPLAAYADGDPLTVINNLSEFIFGLIRAVGLILLG